MQMQLKLAALAVMLAATGAAQAKIANSTDNPTTSGDLFASIVSQSQNATFTVDLGLRLDQFMAAPVNAAGTRLVWDFRNNSFTDGGVPGAFESVGLAASLQTLNYGTVWNTFATPAVTGATDLRFEVLAMDGVPTAFAPAGSNRYLSTSSASSIAADNFQVFNMDSGMDPYVSAANLDTTVSTHGADLNTAGANMFNAGDGFNVDRNNIGDNWNGKTSFTTTGSVASPLNFFFLTNSGPGTGAANITKLAGTWSFDTANARLTYVTAPIPEAETYAMMLAGLGLVGFMVSRRNRRA